jgi:hypothetical protein
MTSSDVSGLLPDLACQGIQSLAAGDVRQNGGIIAPQVLILSSNAAVID